MKKVIKFLTDAQINLANTLKPIIADMNQSTAVADSRGNKIFIYKYDDHKSAPMLTEALCFQPWFITPYFKKGIAQNPDGTLMRDKNNHPIMEVDLCKQKRKEYKQYCKETYGINWEKVFFHGRTDIPMLN